MSSSPLPPSHLLTLCPYTTSEVEVHVMLPRDPLVNSPEIYIPRESRTPNVHPLTAPTFIVQSADVGVTSKMQVSKTATSISLKNQDFITSKTPMQIDSTRPNDAMSSVFRDPPPVAEKIPVYILFPDGPMIPLTKDNENDDGSDPDATIKAAISDKAQLRIVKTQTKINTSEVTQQVSNFVKVDAEKFGPDEKISVNSTVKKLLPSPLPSSFLQENLVGNNFDLDNAQLRMIKNLTSSVAKFGGSKVASKLPAFAKVAAREFNADGGFGVTTNVRRIFLSPLSASPLLEEILEKTETKLAVKIEKKFKKKIDKKFVVEAEEFSMIADSDPRQGPVQDEQALMDLKFEKGDFVSDFGIINLKNVTQSRATPDGSSQKSKMMDRAVLVVGQTVVDLDKLSVTPSTSVFADLSLIESVVPVGQASLSLSTNCVSAALLPVNIMPLKSLDLSLDISLQTGHQSRGINLLNRDVSLPVEPLDLSLDISLQAHDQPRSINLRIRDGYNVPSEVARTSSMTAKLGGQGLSTNQAPTMNSEENRVLPVTVPHHLREETLLENIAQLRTNNNNNIGKQKSRFEVVQGPPRAAEVARQDFDQGDTSQVVRDENNTASSSPVHSDGILIGITAQLRAENEKSIDKNGGYIEALSETDSLLEQAEIINETWAPDAVLRGNRRKCPSLRSPPNSKRNLNLMSPNQKAQNISQENAQILKNKTTTTTTREPNEVISMQPKPAVNINVQRSATNVSQFLTGIHNRLLLKPDGADKAIGMQAHEWLMNDDALNVFGTELLQRIAIGTNRATSPHPQVQHDFNINDTEVPNNSASNSSSNHSSSAPSTVHPLPNLNHYNHKRNMLVAFIPLVGMILPMMNWH